RAGVEPRATAREQVCTQAALREIRLVDVGDLELAARGRLEVLRDVDDAVVVDVEAGDRVVRLRGLRLLLDAEDLAVAVKLGDAVPFGVAHLIGEHGRAVVLLDALEQLRAEALAVE